MNTTQVVAAPKSGNGTGALAESPVRSYNEWDRLEEVIVGSVLNAVKAPYEPSLAPYYSLGDEEKGFMGERFAEEDVAKAQQQLDTLAFVLAKEGVTVRRPDTLDHFRPVTTPDFTIPSGLSSACPRDTLLVIGDEILEAPMAQRSRFFEYRAYRTLIKDYFRRGARWTAAPKPTMGDPLYVPGYTVETEPFHADTHPSLTEFEPCFDGASFVRMGRDIVYQPDVMTNRFGGDWLQRHLGPEYRVHRALFATEGHPPHHLDTTLVPLRPGIVLVNPERPCLDDTLRMFTDNGWEVITAPGSIHGSAKRFYSREVSNWISMNVLVLDEETALVEEAEVPMIRLLESLGFRVLTLAFSEVYKFGGGFHCCTLDIRRRGGLQSYFPSLD